MEKNEMRKVICDFCGARYTIKSSNFPAKAVKVKCKKCEKYILIPSKNIVSEVSQNKHDQELNKYCPKCNSKFTAEANSCPVCGAVKKEHEGEEREDKTAALNSKESIDVGQQRTITQQVLQPIHGKSNTYEEQITKPSHKVLNSKLMDNSGDISQKKCPYCKELILQDANKCKWCQSDISKLNNNFIKQIVSSNLYKKYWQQWGLGEKVIFASFATAFISLFFDWVDTGILSQNGWKQGAYLLLLFYAYPCYTLLKNYKINWYVGFSISILLAYFVFFYINSKSINIFSVSINVSSSGPFIFLFAVILLMFGIYISYKDIFTNGFSVESLIKEKYKIGFLVFSLVLPMILTITIYNQRSEIKHIQEEANQLDAEAYKFFMGLDDYNYKHAPNIVTLRNKVKNFNNAQHLDTAYTHVNNLYNALSPEDDEKLPLLGLMGVMLDKKMELLPAEVLNDINKMSKEPQQ